MSEIPHAIWSGSFRIFGVDVKCHVLSDGQQIIEAESMEKLFCGLSLGADAGDIDAFSQWQRSGDRTDDDPVKDSA